ncbi:hypothetical protein HME9302_00150 [Alteripontixanthobacter maritimus]|uniref:Lipoprotein n=1 Tax=Alteripontixanthobacter maritimus TaxID=2161824 RepID=A0A369Q247_9SPHN|nr:hypothetical protein [Alteripontixanthobacter maritimus]RDC58973.1 hypothetical protein HME9302_00150 [Alteripontixanthobacter maritimus]
MRNTAILLALPLLLPLAACATTAPDLPALPQTQHAFWDALESHCGNAYSGKLVSSDARDVDWARRAMVAHWARCTPTEIAVAFHVEEADGSGWDRSRTWLVSRHAPNETGIDTKYGGLRLKHDHRHEDGSVDAVTQYGGDTLSAGTARIQDFPVDAFSIALFGREGLDVSVTNVWRVEVDDAQTGGARFAYQLTRRNDPTRLFRVEMDAGKPVPAPPAAWGWE